MPAETAHPGHGGTGPSEAAKNSALEALAARRSLTREEARVLAAIGLTAGDRPGHTGRPWDEVDALLVRRLSEVRGWSAVAIATFLHRPESEVLEMLRSMERPRGPRARGRTASPVPDRAAADAPA